jgi:hypothetical protein
MDVDLVADLRREQVGQFIQSLGQAFYVDEGMIRSAIEGHAHFNLIHLATTFKVDIFIPKDRPFDRQQMARRVKRTVATEPDRTAYIASAEDIILAKLEWYRLGGESSARQWGDILGILEIQGDQLDYDYLRHWSAELKIADLLERALSEGGVVSGPG